MLGALRLRRRAGDRPDAEIAAALRLGMRAMRIRGGEFAARPTPAGAVEADDVRAVLPVVGAPPQSQRAEHSPRETTGPAARPPPPAA